MQIQYLEFKALEMRKKVWKMIYDSGTGHTGSDLSCTDILIALYYDVLKINPAEPKWVDRDRYIQSKGHAVEILWSVLADKGFFSENKLKTYGKFHTDLIGHPNNKVAGIEMNTGSLGHGLSIAVGVALNAKITNKDYLTYTLMGDGEQAEGSIWEAAMAANHYRLDNLIGIIDNNGLQITGSNEEVMDSSSLKQKYQAFGWNVQEIDGNNMSEIVNALKNVKKNGHPNLVIAHTLKGKGVKVAEDRAEWHHKVPTKEQYEAAMADFDKKLGGDFENGEK